MTEKPENFVVIHGRERSYVGIKVEGGRPGVYREICSTDNEKDAESIRHHMENDTAPKPPNVSTYINTDLKPPAESSTDKPITHIRR